MVFKNLRYIMIDSLIILIIILFMIISYLYFFKIRNKKKKYKKLNNTDYINITNKNKESDKKVRFDETKNEIFII